MGSNYKICSECGEKARMGMGEVSSETCTHNWEPYIDDTYTAQYMRDCLVTESRDFAAIIPRLGGQNLRLLHGAMGAVTESGELLDALKKHFFYGKSLDLTNLMEEMGDLFWYCAIMADALGVGFQEVMDKNIAKLKARYGDKFTEAAATTRDLARERGVLEK